jgi:DNA recombination protein RmuC
MNELVTKIGSDSTLMFMGAIALVILLFIVLVVVVSSMRVKSYKDRFLNLQIDNKEKEKLISELQKELQVFKIKDAQNEQELQQFAHTKENLLHTETTLAGFQKEHNELEKLQSQTHAKFENVQNMYENVLKEHKHLQERYEQLTEDNSKLRINSARLLVKLETEARFKSEMSRRSSDGEEKKTS